MTIAHLTMRSRNVKTGPMPVSTTERGTCPPDCPFYDNGCYGKYGHVGMFWQKLTNGQAGQVWREFIRQVRAIPARQLWRHNQAGDLPGKGNRINHKQTRQLAQANGDSHGFTFTHKPLDKFANRDIIAEINRTTMFTINLSANNLSHADRLFDENIGPVAVVLPANQLTNTVTPAGRTITVCPAVTHGINCAKCGLCWRKDRKVGIGFPAHGQGTDHVNTIAMQ